MAPASPGRPAALRAAIQLFLQERLDAKLKPLQPDDPKRQALLAQFEFKTWISDAARRAGQIQVVTHALKATHPDARGTSLYKPPQTLAPQPFVGSHCLTEDFTYDVDGNAGAMDVYAFLRVSHDGNTLLSLMLSGDPDVHAALSDDPDEAGVWIEAFVAIAKPGGPAMSHALAKQMYWHVGLDSSANAGYHLLAPLYSSSLAHAVFVRIEKDLYDDAVVDARQARKAGKFHETPLHIYPNLALQRIGGTSAKSRLNVSSLNGVRRGKNYLLASLPPLWESDELKAPLRMENAIHAYGRLREVRRLVRELAAFLKSDPGATMETRNSRDDWTDQLIDELLHYGALVQHTLEPGWSADPACLLLEHQKLWLDPFRAHGDGAFAQKWRAMQWVQGVYDDFALWLNDRLGKAMGVQLGDPQETHWGREFKSEQEFLWQIDQMRRRMDKLEALKGGLVVEL